MASSCAVLPLLFAALFTAARGQILAPLDADVECLNASTLPGAGSNTVVLLDSYQYTSLESLWFADDESIDLFAFPVPEDPVRWKLVDQSECRNVWQYCGDSISDILITQFVSGEQNGSNNEVIVSVEYAFFSSEHSVDICSPENSDNMAQSNAVIVEVDDTTGLNNIHTEYIPQCVNNMSRSRHDFLYTPMYRHFEVVFRSNLSEGICVNISRVSIFHCGSSRRAVRGDTSTATCIPCQYIEPGNCLPCPDRSIFAIDHCECEVGYQRVDRANFSLPCNQCTNGYFMTINGSCMACPLPGFDSPDSMVDTCQCFNETLSNNNTCQFCAANHYRDLSSGECVLCPAGSRRPVVLDDSGVPLPVSESFCTCTEESLTGSRENITNQQICDQCELQLYWNGSQCATCPANSHGFLSNATQCACDSGTLTLAGQNSTTTQQCFCMSGLYRVPDLDECQSCPNMSFRALGDPEHICGCLEGYRRENDTCFPYVGFNTTTLTLEERNGEVVYSIPIILSQASEDVILVSVSARAVNPVNRDLQIILSESVTFFPALVRLHAILSYTGNAVALEEDAILNLSLALSSREAESVLIGGPELFSSLTVTIRDDDLLHVGFTENWLTFNSSQQSGHIGVNISTDIGRSVVILIRANDSLSPTINPSQPRELTFEANNATSLFFEFDVKVDRESTRYVLISLEIPTYLESLNSVRNRITVGQLPGLYREAVLVLQKYPAAGGLSGSTAVVIGVVCLAVFLCVLAAAIVISLWCFLQQRSAKGVQPKSEYDEVAMGDLEHEKEERETDKRKKSGRQKR